MSPINLTLMLNITVHQPRCVRVLVSLINHDAEHYSVPAVLTGELHGERQEIFVASTTHVPCGEPGIAGRYHFTQPQLITITPGATIQKSYILTELCRFPHGAGTYDLHHVHQIAVLNGTSMQYLQHIILAATAPFSLGAVDSHTDSLIGSSGDL